MKLVLDTDVIVAGLRSPTGASAALLRSIRRGQGVLLLSATLLFEYEAICRRPDHRLATGLTAGDIEVFLDGLVFLAEPVETHFRWRPQLRDPGDEMVLETAVNGRAAGIVTFNRRDYGETPARFGLLLLSPGEALRRLEP